MRIAHLIKAAQIGGAERYLLILLKHLRQRGHDVHLLLLVEKATPMDHLVTLAQQHGILVERIPIRSNMDVMVINRIRGQLRKIKPDILHTHLIHADTFGVPAGRLARVPAIITGRHNDNEFRKRSLIKAVNNMVWKRVKAGIVVSEALKQFLSEVENAPQDKLHVVNYGIEHQSMTPDEQTEARRALRNQLNLSEDTVLLGMACRLIEQKGVTYALQAMKQLVNDYPDCHLVIAGDGELREDLMIESSQMGLDKRVQFIGWQNDVPMMLAGLDIFLMPSLWEGFGLVMLEAMSKRLPVVGSHVSAIPEVVSHGETGILVPPKNPEALADALRILLDDRPLRTHMGLVGEDRLEQHFTAKHMTDKTLNIYQSV